MNAISIVKCDGVRDFSAKQCKYTSQSVVNKLDTLLYFSLFVIHFSFTLFVCLFIQESFACEDYNDREEEVAWCEAFSR